MGKKNPNLPVSVAATNTGVKKAEQNQLNGSSEGR